MLVSTLRAPLTIFSLSRVDVVSLYIAPLLFCEQTWSFQISISDILVPDIVSCFLSSAVMVAVLRGLLTLIWFSNVICIRSARPVLRARIAVLSSGAGDAVPPALDVQLWHHLVERPGSSQRVPHLDINSGGSPQIAKRDSFHGDLKRRGKLGSVPDNDWAPDHSGEAVQKKSRHGGARPGPRKPFRKQGERFTRKVLWFRIVGRAVDSDRILPQLSHSLYPPNRKGTPIPPATTFLGPLSYKLPRSYLQWECVTAPSCNMLVPLRFPESGAGLTAEEKRQIKEEVSALGREGMNVSIEENISIDLYLERFQWPAGTGNARHTSGRGVGSAH